MDHIDDDYEGDVGVESVNPAEETIATFLLAKNNLEWVLACNKIIMLLGAHPGIQDKDLGIDNSLPPLPNRDLVRRNFIKSITPVFILQSGGIQRAEDEGQIDRVMSKLEKNSLARKASLIINALSEKKIIDIEKIISIPQGIPLEGGGFRKGYRGSQ